MVRGQWYEDEEAGLGGQFVDELRHIVRRIRELPSQFPEIGRGTRRALLKRFPYAIYFLLRGEADQRAALILAVLHHSGAARLFGRNALETKAERANSALAPTPAGSGRILSVHFRPRSPDP
ncbi:hypothetical protein [Sorangium sp. So ce145]|uniref:hypothetical protein n=1 Tax=Sorangium sp. So ce145 TaxID=3133285 RepID=UPI003F5FDC54